MLRCCEQVIYDDAHHRSEGLLLTPEDHIVWGGNFLNILAIALSIFLVSFPASLKADRAPSRAI